MAGGFTSEGISEGDSMKQFITFEVRECTCGKDHKEVEFVSLPQPEDPFVFEGTCPSNGTKIYW